MPRRPVRGARVIRFGVTPQKPLHAGSRPRRSHAGCHTTRLPRRLPRRARGANRPVPRIVGRLDNGAVESGCRRRRRTPPRRPERRHQPRRQCEEGASAAGEGPCGKSSCPLGRARAEPCVANDERAPVSRSFGAFRAPASSSPLCHAEPGMIRTSWIPRNGTVSEDPTCRPRALARNRYGVSQVQSRISGMSSKCSRTYARCRASIVLALVGELALAIPASRCASGAAPPSRGESGSSR